MNIKQIKAEAFRLAQELYDDWLIGFEELDIPEKERLEYLQSVEENDDAGFSDLCDQTYSGKLNDEALKNAHTDMMFIGMRRRYIQTYRNPKLILQEAETKNSTRSSSRQPKPFISIIDTLEEFLTEKKHKNPRLREGTLNEYRSTVRDLCEILDTDNLVTIDRDAATTFRNTIQKLPKQHRAREGYKSKSIDELLEMNISSEQRPSAKTINGKLTILLALFESAKQRDLIEKNPFEDLSLREEANTSYRPFSDDDLKMIFSSPLYADARYRQSKKTGKQSQWWLLVLGLFTGARIGELAQLRVQDIKEENGIHTMSITDEGDGMSVKTSAGIRTFPIHKTLLALGFLEYVQYLRKQGIDRVLEQMPLGVEKPGDTASKWFNERYRGKHFPQLKNQRKVFHSFRHTFVQRAIQSGMDIHKLQQIVGHEPSLLGETATYKGQGFSMQQLKVELDNFDYEKFGISDIAGSWRELYPPIKKDKINR